MLCDQQYQVTTSEAQARVKPAKLHSETLMLQGGHRQPPKELAFAILVFAVVNDAQAALLLPAALQQRPCTSIYLLICSISELLCKAFHCLQAVFRARGLPKSFNQCAPNDDPLCPP